MSVAVERIGLYLRMRLLGPFPLLLLAGLNAGSAFGSINQPDAELDMEVFRASGRALLAGTTPYALVGTNNLNAPGSLPWLHVAAASLDPVWTPTTWYFASLAAYLLSLLILALTWPSTASRTRLAWAIAQYGVWITIGYSELYAFLLLPLAVASWAITRDKLFVAAISAGFLIAFKPNFTLWPLLLLTAGHRRQGLAILAGTALWSLVPVVLYGPGVYFDWLAMIRGRMGLELSFGHNSSLQSLSYRHGLPWAGIPLSACAMAGLMAWGWRARPDPVRAAPVALLTGILASPISMPGYLCFLIPGFLSRSWNRPLWMAAALMLVPLWIEQFLGPGFKPLWSAGVTVSFASIAVGLLAPVRRSGG